jgi:CspA family cold shock protein
MQARESTNAGENDVPTGTVKFFSLEKGYGFIRPDGGNKDDFVHITAVQRSGLQTLHEGQKVSYDLVTGRNGKASADNLRVG